MNLANVILCIWALQKQVMAKMARVKSAIGIGTLLEDGIG